MAIANNSFCWNGIVSEDPEKAKAFYEAVIGWKANEYTFPNGERSTMFFNGDRPCGHLRTPESGEPNQWTSYLRVEGVDGAATAAVSAGGGEMIPPTDIAPGRFAAVRSPGGSSICLFHEADEESADNAPASEGFVNWTELQSRDVEADRHWLSEAFGFSVEEMPIPNGTYYLLKVGEEVRGGLCSAVNEDVAGRWLCWVHVPDVDEALDRAQSTGGSAVTEPSDYPGVGRMAMVRDATGAVFGLITPTAGG